MNAHRILASFAFTAASLVGAVQAQAAEITREQVRAELAEARRNGELLAGGESGLRHRDISPTLYPVSAAKGMKSRAEVRADLDRARASGELIAVGDAGLRERDLPHRQPAHVRMGDKSRADVRAELSMAQMLGEIVGVGEDGRTLAEMHPHRYAAARAAAAKKAMDQGRVAQASGETVVR